MKKIIISILFVLLILLSGCVIENDDNGGSNNNGTNHHEIDTDLSYIYDVKDFEYDVSEYIISDKEVCLPNLEGMNRGQIKYILDKLGLLFDFKFSYEHVESADYNKFVKYSEPYEAGMIINRDDSPFIYVYTTVLALTHSIVNELKIDFDYVGKSFLDDGVGSVFLVRCIDGDTAWFRDMNGEEFKLRFMCVDTPESTVDHDPWGKEASNYTASILKGAKEIVLSREENKIKETYGRYLGYVWVDGVLLNLLLVEQAYSNAGASESKYKNYFIEAMLHAQATGRRFYGEIDPNYDYELGDFK